MSLLELLEAKRGIIIEAWSTPLGQTTLTALLLEGMHILSESANLPLDLAYNPHEFQAIVSGKILDRIDTLLTTATGDGKSGCFYLPLLVYIALEGGVTDKLVIVVCPTNLLGLDLARSMVAKGFKALALNEKSVRDAKGLDRDLWREVKDAKWNLMMLSPELMLGKSFLALARQKGLGDRLISVCVDEAHLVDHWGADFRKAYLLIGKTRTILPITVPYLATTATLAPGRYLQSITSSLHFHKTDYCHLARYCGRPNTEIIWTSREYSFSGETMLDLEWIVPETIQDKLDLRKTVIFCKSIDEGARVTLYLRSLFPMALHSQAEDAVRHLHALNCAQCQENFRGALSNNDSASGRVMRILVTTELCTHGIDITDIDDVIIWGTPDSLDQHQQRAGRAARDPQRKGRVICYWDTKQGKAVQPEESTKDGEGPEGEPEARGGEVRQQERLGRSV